MSANRRSGGKFIRSDGHAARSEIAVLASGRVSQAAEPRTTGHVFGNERGWRYESPINRADHWHVMVALL